MSDAKWSYECEDELEARGVSLLLERRGLAFIKGNHSDGSVTFTCAGAPALEAAALEAELLRHHAKRERADGEKRWTERDHTRDRRLRRVGVVILGFVALITALNC